MILTPRYLAGVADGVVDIFSQAENEILADIARRIVKTGGVSNTAGWQLQKMREAGMLNEDTVKQLAAATNQSEAEIQRMLKESYKRALSFDIDVIPADLKMSWTQIKDNPAFRAIMLQGVNNANQLVSNFTKATAGAAQTAFFNALDVSYLQHITGAQTREEAVRGALKKLAQQGIYKVAYPQDNGGVYYNSVEAAVRRALTTAVNQSCAKLQLANCDMLGTDLVETTAHLGARPSHAVWQGKVFSRSGSTKKYPDFVKSTGYGTGDGLCGWNCRHSFFPYFEGYSTPAYDLGKFDSEENARLYEEEQKQRRYERMVREAKREVSTLEAGFEAAESPELQEGIAADLQQAKNKLRNRQKRLRDYCNEHGLYNDYSRTYTAGYNDKNRVKIGNKNTSKKLANSGRSGIIELPRTIQLDDIQIFRTLSAKAKNYDVMDLVSGDIYHIAEGTKIQNVKVFAGKGTRVEFRNAAKYAERYGGTPENWQHVKGFCELVTPEGNIKAEIHWVQCDGIGKKEFFVKEWFE